MSDPQSLARDVAALTDLANRFSQSGRHEEAAELLFLALRLDPKNLSVKLGLAEARKQQRLQTGGPARSVKDMLREGFRRNAIDAAHFLGLAHLYAEKGENARATECLEIAKAKSLATPSTHKLHGRLLFRRKDFDGAVDELTQALRYNPFDREVSELLGRTEYERKQYEGALRATVHAFLLLNEGDNEGVERLRRRIQTLKQILGWGNRELGQIFRERQEHLRTAFDRLEWHRERFLEESGLASLASLGTPVPAAARREGRGQLEMAARLRRLKPWAHFSDEQIFSLTHAVGEEVHDAGDLVFAHRSQGCDLYLLESGEINLQRTTGYGTFVIGSVLPGELFGEPGFVTRHEHGADAVATLPCQVLRLDADALEPLLEGAPDLGVQLFWTLWHSLARKLRATNEQLKSFFSAEVTPESFLRLRKQPSGVAASIKVEENDKIRLFREQGISRKELITLAAFSKEKRFAAGASLFQEGDAGSEMYVILEGRALISKFIPGAGEEALAILERGDFFGEMALIDGEPRSADARAYSGPLTVLALDQSTVHEVLSMDPEAAMEFLQLLCRLIASRLREIDEKVISWRIMSGERNESASA
ncbi:MAG TPA: cyclic nucleotide-binding domain-containing protein [Thermoanaerobaculia bacterium]|nr:cyclic nucleotide-binding domain-containing protein [Thermoanaerobaculia bacterium]